MSLGTLDICNIVIKLSRQRTTKVLIRLLGFAGRAVPLLFEYVLKGFSHDEAQLISFLLYPPANYVCGGVYCFHVVRPSVHLSVRPSVRDILVFFLS